MNIDERKRRWLNRAGFKPVTSGVVSEIGETDPLLRGLHPNRVIEGYPLYRRYGSVARPYSLGYLERVTLWELKVEHRKFKREAFFKESKIGKALKWIEIAIRHRVIP